MATTLISLPCLCGSLRRATRALTQVYEDALRDLDLSASQLTILQVLSRAGELSQGQLAQILAMDSTTLTRTLAIMRRQGWIAERRGRDRRERRLRLSRAGQMKLNRAMPLWENLQSRLRRRLGDQSWTNLLQLSNQLTDLTLHGESI